MPQIPCPCCRATNDAPPACRRCKADLSLLFGVMTQRDALMADAMRHIAAGDFFAALCSIGDVESLRSGGDVSRLRAVVHLLSRDFHTAWACYSAVGK